MAYLTIAEAIEKHGKSDSSYRRLIRDVRKSGDARKRQLIKPSEKEIEEFRRTGQTYTYTIAEDLLEQETQTAASEHKEGSGKQPTANTVDRELIDGLISRMEERHDKEVARLERQLKEERDAAATREARIQKYAEKDKERFAKASEHMTRAIANAKSLTQNLMLPLAANPNGANPMNSDTIPGKSRPKQGSANEFTDSTSPKKSNNKATQQSDDDDNRAPRSRFWKRILGR
jgi:hypothetical protein